MRRSIPGAAVAVLAATTALTLQLVLQPAPHADAAGGVTATFTVASDWGTGHEVHVVVTNGTAQAVPTWRIGFDLPDGTAITSSWDADVVRTGNHYVATAKSWAGPLAPGGTQAWGYIGSGPFRAPVLTPPSGPPPTTGPPTSPATTGGPTTAAPTTAAPTTGGPPGAHKVVGYFAEWGIYARGYHVKNVVTSGSAAKLTDLVYAFGNVTNGQCAIGDSYADYDRFYSADESVDGVADSWDAGALRGSFGQLRRLKRMYPQLKVVWSFGGWTWSSGFTQAAQDPAAFADSCYRLVEDPRWAGVFDGIDIDWEYPNACGNTCDTSGPNAFPGLIGALRSRFGASALVTAAITADATSGGKMDAANYAAAAPDLSWIMPMTYDFFGAWAATGPTAPHSPLTAYPGIPIAGYTADAAVQKLKNKGVPAGKILLGIGFYGRGWTGVTQSAPGGSATGPAPGTYEQGIEDYKVLKTRCPATGTAGGTAYGFCGNEWWGYDTPATIAGKTAYVRDQNLGGAFFWELSGDTPDGELVDAIGGGLR